MASGSASRVIRPVLREERPRILGVEPRFNGVALRSGLEPGEPLAVRDAELQLDEIEPGHGLGHGVLDLDPGVQLQEEDLAPVDEELHGPGALVAELRGERDRMGGEPLAHRVGEAGRGGLLDDLLVTPLHRAVALAEGDDRAVPVAEHLHLHMARLDEVALAEDRAVAERRLGLAGCAVERVREILGALRRRACRARRHPPPP